MIKITRIMAGVMCLAAFSYSGAAFAACEDIKDLKLPRAEIVVAEAIPAGFFSSPGTALEKKGTQYKVPAFCRVRGVARPTEQSNINFEVWLPDNWNGRYYQATNGGWSGFIDYGALAKHLSTGAAVANTDDGRVIPKSEEDRWEWVRGKPERLVDHSHRALKVTTDHAKAIIKSHYGTPSNYNYVGGCSGGGHYAMTAAVLYPEDWDGVMVGSTSAGGRWMMEWAFGQRWAQDPANRIPRTKLPAIQRKAKASCRPEAQLVDGVPGDPRLCSFDPAEMICKGKETDECLTPPQAETLRLIYEGPKDPETGEQLFPGFPPTAEAEEFNTGGWVASWATMLTGQGKISLDGDAVSEVPGVVVGTYSFFRDRIFKDSNWDDLANFAYTAENRAFVESKFDNLPGYGSYSPLKKALDVDMSEAINGGTKIMLYYGWAEDMLPPGLGVHHYETTVKHVGQEKTDESFRLYMVPGLGHCVGGPGAASFGQVSGPGSGAAGEADVFIPPLKNDPEHDIYRALEAWVEEGRAPEEIIGVKYVDDNAHNGVEMTRPICAYPKVPKYKGSGSTKEAKNFECVTN